MIKFSGVSLTYPHSQKTLFENLTFTVESGEMILVIGHTGAGKSSILKLINGLIPHHTGGILSGTVEVDGRATYALKPGELADLVGVVGQNPKNGFVCDIVEDEIAFSLENLGFPAEQMRKRVEEVLDLLALAPLRGRELLTLSGGEQQRVAIAAALVTQPKVLLLDEPTSALDPIAAEEVLSILHRLVHDLGLTIILAEHRLERVIQFVDRVLLIRNEREIDFGLTREVLRRSPIAPPLVELAKTVGMSETPLSIREFRKSAPKIEPSNQHKPLEKKFEVVKVDELSASYDEDGSTYALENISLSLYSAEVVALMGRNGAGKTTLLRSISGQSPTLRGKVIVDGRDPRTLAGKELISRVGYVPQDPGDLLYGSSIEEECEFSDRDSGVDKGVTWRIYQSLMRVPDPKTHPRDISEGQRLGLVLSIVLAAAPKVLILDEPTRGLDYEAKKSLISIIKKLVSESSCTVCIATHDVELVAEIADRVLFIADGEIITDSDARSALLSSPAFAPQVSKAYPEEGFLTVSEVCAGFGSQEQRRSAGDIDNEI
jgi:energy-coupling factor transport system ATP-binding protein